MKMKSEAVIMGKSGVMVTREGNAVDFTDAFSNVHGAFVNQSLALKKLENGNIYLAVAQITVPASGDAYVGIETGTGNVCVNIQSMTLSSGIIIAEMFEGSDFTTGTMVNINNMNRRSTNTSTVTVSTAPTVNSEGTKIDEVSFGSTGIGNSITVSVLDAQLPWALKTNTKYLFKLTNSDGNDVDVIVRMVILED